MAIENEVGEEVARKGYWLGSKMLQLGKAALRGVSALVSRPIAYAAALATKYRRRRRAGKVSKKLLRWHGKDTGIVTIPQDRLKDLNRQAKQLGIEFSVIKTKKSDTYDILFDVQEAAKMKTVLARCGIGALGSGRETKKKKEKQSEVEKQPARELFRKARQKLEQAKQSKAQDQTQYQHLMEMLMQEKQRMPVSKGK